MATVKTDTRDNINTPSVNHELKSNESSKLQKDNNKSGVIFGISAFFDCSACNGCSFLWSFFCSHT